MFMTQEEAINFFTNTEMKFVDYEDKTFQFSGEKDDKLIIVRYFCTDIQYDVFRATTIFDNSDELMFFNQGINSSNDENNGKEYYSFKYER